MCQLDDLSDFEKLLSPSGHISICGFASLLSGPSSSVEPCDGEERHSLLLFLRLKNQRSCLKHLMDSPLLISAKADPQPSLGGVDCVTEEVSRLNIDAVMGSKLIQLQSISMLQAFQIASVGCLCVFVNLQCQPQMHFHLSSYGQNIVTSTLSGETLFCILICIGGLVFFSHLIGNMQSSLQSTTARIEEWRIRRRDTEEWIRHCQLPPDFQDHVHRFVHYRWIATRGVDEEAILRSLPLDLRHQIQSIFVLPLFTMQDEYCQNRGTIENTSLSLNNVSLLENFSESISLRGSGDDAVITDQISFQQSDDGVNDKDDSLVANHENRMELVTEEQKHAVGDGKMNDPASWIIHACVSIWWPYPFLGLSSPIAPLWYCFLAFMHLPCNGLFALIVNTKHYLLSKWFPQSYRCLR
ncbi:hypothetical protein CRYUN_Cryun22dG0016100 [Craigia yunnanensis]